MNLVDVIENLVDEKGLDKDQVTAIVCEGIKAAYQKRYPSVDFSVVFNKRQGQMNVFAQKEVVSFVEDDTSQISLRKAKTLDPKVSSGDKIAVPFEESIGRIEILTAKQLIANKIRNLEHLAVYNEFQEREGSIVTGVVHKKNVLDMLLKLVM